MKVKYSLSSVLSRQRMYSTGSNWRVSHMFLFERELLLSGTGAVLEGWLEIKIRVIILVLPTRLLEREGSPAGLYCSLQVHHKESGPLTNPIVTPACT